MSSQPGWKSLNVAIVGGGIGGLAAAISLRRAGHKVTIYERADFAGEVGASISCAANGSRWLHQWNVDIPKGDPVILRKLINRDWETGEAMNVYDLGDYQEKWGYVRNAPVEKSNHTADKVEQYYYMFHRQYMHAMLMECATQEEGEGVPVTLIVNHKVRYFQRLQE